MQLQRFAVLTPSRKSQGAFKARRLEGERRGLPSHVNPRGTQLGLPIMSRFHRRPVWIRPVSG